MLLSALKGITGMATGLAATVLLMGCAAMLLCGGIMTLSGIVGGIHDTRELRSLRAHGESRRFDETDRDQILQACGERSLKRLRSDPSVCVAGLALPQAPENDLESELQLVLYGTTPVSFRIEVPRA